MKFKTMSVHSGQRIDPQTGALTTPLYQSSTFSYFNAQAGKERFAGQAPGFIYSRFGNPTTAELEQKLAALEGPTKPWWWRAHGGGERHHVCPGRQRR